MTHPDTHTIVEMTHPMAPARAATVTIGGTEYRIARPARLDSSGNYAPSRYEAVPVDRTVPHTGYRRTYGTTY